MEKETTQNQSENLKPEKSKKWLKKLKNES
jgi:hypothetical protein